MVGGTVSILRFYGPNPTKSANGGSVFSTFSRRPSKNHTGNYHYHLIPLKSQHGSESFSILETEWVLVELLCPFLIIYEPVLAPDCHY